MEKAIALLEVQAMVAAAVGLDAMLKAADVRFIHVEKKLGGRLCEVIARPHKEILRFLYQDIQALDDPEELPSGLKEPNA